MAISLKNSLTEYHHIPTLYEWFQNPFFSTKLYEYGSEKGQKNWAIVLGFKSDLDYRDAGFTGDISNMS